MTTTKTFACIADATVYYMQQGYTTDVYYEFGRRMIKTDDDCIVGEVLINKEDFLYVVAEETA